MENSGSSASQNVHVPKGTLRPVRYPKMQPVRLSESRGPYEAAKILNMKMATFCRIAIEEKTARTFQMAKIKRGRRVGTL